MIDKKNEKLNNPKENKSIYSLKGENIVKKSSQVKSKSTVNRQEEIRTQFLYQPVKSEFLNPVFVSTISGPALLATVE